MPIATTPPAKKSLDIKELYSKIKDKLLSLLWKKTSPQDIAEKNKKKFIFSKQIVLTKKQAVSAGAVRAITLLVVLGFWFYVYSEYNTINSKSTELSQLNKFSRINISQDMKNTFISYLTDADNISTIQNLLDVKESVSLRLENYKKLFANQTNYYNLFLRHLYFPTLNVRKDPYTEQIDTSIIWQKYLETDPFQNLSLIQYRSDFFKNVWEDTEYNDITEILIWNMEDIDSEHFIIPISLRFTSPNKRSFLLLVNKLSTTSSMTNISLLNEFFFYLVKNIEEDKESQILQEKNQFYKKFIATNWLDTSWATQNEINIAIPTEKIIWYNLHQRLKWSWNTAFLDDSIIEKTIIQATNCDDLTLTCLYNFREKYRDFPFLAYTIGMPNNTQKSRVDYFKDFLSDLAPIIAVKSFSFEKRKINLTLDSTTQVYQWSITFNAYWRSIPTSEVEEIAKALWKQCFPSNDKENPDNFTLLSIDDALSRIQSSLTNMWDNLQSSDTVNHLEELNWIITKMQKEYNSLNNYNKVIKLFELYRMLKDWNICNV